MSSGDRYCAVCGLANGAHQIGCGRFCQPLYPALPTTAQPTLTKLEHFAGLAMQGELAAQNVNSGEMYMTNDANAKTLAERCVLFAKALIAELEKEQSK